MIRRIIPFFLCQLSLMSTLYGYSAYVLESDINEISVIDTSTNTVIDTITSPSFNFTTGDCVITNIPGGTYVFVANSGDTTISVIQASTNTVINTITIDTERVSGMAVTPNETAVYLTNRRSQTINVMDIPNFTITATITTADYPRGIAITPDGSLALIANLNGTVTVIDTSTNTITKTIPVNNYCSTIAISPDGSVAYVGCINDGVAILDIATLTVLSPFISAGGMFIAFTPDGKSTYSTTTFDYNIDVIDVTTETIVDTIRLEPGNTAWAIAITADSKFAYVTCANTGVVSIIDTSSNQVIGTIPLSSTWPTGISIL